MKRLVLDTTRFILTGRGPVHPYIEEQDTTPNYLEPLHENFFSIEPYEIKIDRANYPKDEVGVGIILKPDTLFSRLDEEIMDIPGTIRTQSDRRELYNLLAEQEQKVREGKLSDNVIVHYLLRRYSGGVGVSLEKQEFLPEENYPKGLSWIVMRANYAGEPGARIKELEEIATKNDLKEWVTGKSGF